MQRFNYLTDKIKKEDKYPFRQNCYKCFRPMKLCLCSDIDAFDTRTRFVILMHPKEARKVRLGTGYLTHLCLENSEIRVGVDFTEDERVNDMIACPDFNSVLLYPQEDSIEIGEYHFPHSIPAKLKPLAFVIDASWTLARKMIKLSVNLQNLPKIHFSPQEPSRYIIKKQPHASCLSTIESVYALLQELNKRGIEECHGKHESLLICLDRMCHRQITCTNDKSLAGYRKNTTEYPGKTGQPDAKCAPGKRQRRSVCFD